MKGLVTTISALAMVAGVASAQVQSTNIVGYLDKGGDVDALISVSPTFVTVGEATTPILADIGVNEAGKEGGLYLRFFAANGDPLAEGDIIWVDASAYTDNAYPNGWYLASVMESGDFESCLVNSKPVPAGTGFVLIPAANGAALKFKGEVKQAEQEITGDVDALIRVGNASPIDLTLQKITCNEAGKEGGLYLRFFAANGDPLAEGDIIWVDAAGYTDDAYPNGWYLASVMESGDFDSCLVNSKSVPAGSGFVLIPAASGAKIIVPNPMTVTLD